MTCLSGKKGVIIGIANERSICWGIADECLKQGAKLAVSYLDITEKRVRGLIEGTDTVAAKCDVSSDESIIEFFEFVKKELGEIDFMVCGPAFANKEALKGKYYNVSRQDFAQAMDISVYALTAVAKAAEPLMKDGGSILTLTYYGAEKIIPNYNIMGVAKAALEASVRYLANDFGERGIRVNSISAGPVKTLASSAIGEFRKVLGFGEAVSPMKRNITQNDVAKTAIYLLSDLSSGVTAENIHVDCGLSAVGMFFYDDSKKDGVN